MLNTAGISLTDATFISFGALSIFMVQPVTGSVSGALCGLKWRVGR